MSIGETSYDRINDYSAVKIISGPSARHSQLVVRRSEKAGNDQLPHVSSRARRPVLRTHFWPGKRLGMRLRQVPRHEVQGHDLRSLRREGHAQPRAPQADGAHRSGRAGGAHLVLQGHAQPLGQLARHENHEPGKGDLLPGLRRHRSEGYSAQAAAIAHRGRISPGPRAIRRRRVSTPKWARKPCASCW